MLYVGIIFDFFTLLVVFITYNDVFNKTRIRDATYIHNIKMKAFDMYNAITEDLMNIFVSRV